jgi:hypothetical protein
MVRRDKGLAPVIDFIEVRLGQGSLNSSVVMKYFVSDKFRLLYFLIATKGAACREIVL